MFDDIRQALDDLLHGNVPAADRRDLLTEMRGTLVRARMAVDDLRDGLAASEKRLVHERAELDTVLRRKALAEKASDAETVSIAAKFEAQHAERVALLEKKVEVGQAELAMVEREVEEMTVQFKAASAGVGSGLRSGATDGLGGVGPDGPEGDESLRQELGALDRQTRRAAKDAEADEKLAELKRRMGL